MATKATTRTRTTKAAKATQAAQATPNAALPRGIPGTATLALGKPYSPRANTAQANVQKWAGLNASIAAGHTVQEIVNANAANAAKVQAANPDATPAELLKLTAPIDATYIGYVVRRGWVTVQTS